MLPEIKPSINMIKHIHILEVLEFNGLAHTLNSQVLAHNGGNEIEHVL
jgi:hypothetical protein